jgi:prepilin-type N-terminal cleavage/methylation domain-containing protein
MLARRNLTRSGYSLIELCLVIAIMAIILSLLMAGIQKVRAAAAQFQSNNNLWEMIMAAHAYQAAKKSLSCSQEVEKSIVDQPWRYPWIPNSLFICLLPHLDQKAAYLAYLASPSALDYVGMEVFTNPSDPSMDGDGFASGIAATAYAVNATALPQLYHRLETWNTTNPPQHNEYSWGKSVRLDTNIPDKTSNTVILSEKYATCSWATYSCPIASRFDLVTNTGPDAHTEGCPGEIQLLIGPCNRG